MSNIGKLAPFLDGIRRVSGSAERDVIFPFPDTNQRVENEGTGYVEKYDGANWNADIPLLRGGQSYNVLAYGAKGDGSTNDAVAIQAAIDAAGNAGGGCAVLPPGHVFKITAGLTMRPNVWLMGNHGRNTSLLAPALNGSTDAITIPTGTFCCTVYGLRIDPAVVGGTCRDNIHVDTSDDCRLRFVWSKSAQRHGIYVNATPCTLVDCVSELNGADGLQVTGTNSAQPTHVLGGYFFQNGGNGITAITNANQMIVVGAEIYTNGGAGVLVQASRYAKITGCSIALNGSYGVYFFSSAEDGTVNGCDIGQNQLEGVAIDNSSYCGVTGHSIIWDNGKVSAGTRDGILIANASVGAYVGGGTVIRNRDGAFQRFGINVSSASSTRLGEIIYSALATGNLNNNDTSAEIAPNAGFAGAQISNDRVKTARQVLSGRFALTYGTTIAVDAGLGNYAAVTATNGTGFTFNVPTNAPAAGFGQTLSIEIFNNSGGALGTITWTGGAGGYLLPVAFTAPATTKRRKIVFEFSQGANAWVKVFESGDY